MYLLESAIYVYILLIWKQEKLIFINVTNDHFVPTQGFRQYTVKPR